MMRLVYHTDVKRTFSGTCQTATMLADEYDRKVHVVNNQRISVTHETVSN